MKIIARDYLDEANNQDISDFSIIEFGEGGGKICVAVREGQIEVCSEHGQLVVRPRVANVIVVSAED